MNKESTVDVLFNRNPLVYAGKMEEPSVQELKTTFGLWNASWDDAIRYGGEVTREALRCMNIRHDRKNIIVDTKIHMLMKGMSPAIPGVHQDGSPRDENKHPNGKGPPDILAQEGDTRFNRYHILVSGTGCLTKFVKRPLSISIPAEPSYEVYSHISKYVNDLAKKEDLFMEIPSCTAVEFDWYDLHTGVLATKNEWRFLIRVAESDYYEPQKDLREVIRLQSQVYSPMDFSW